MSKKPKWPSRSISASSSNCSNESPSSAAVTAAIFKNGSGIGKFRLSKHPNIFKMIESEEWAQVRNFIPSSQGRKICKKSDTSGLSVLGMALGFHAPLDIVVKLLEIDPSSSLKPDMFRAVPLHVACLNGADLEIVNYLLDHDENSSAFCTDNDKRVALHHAVEYACNFIQDDEAMENENDGIDVIKSLATAAPRMIHCYDIHGDTPVDMTQMLKYELKNENNPKYKKVDALYKILKEISIRLYRKDKKQWERKKDKLKNSKNSQNSNEDTASTGLSRMEELTLSDSVEVSKSETTENKKKRKKFLSLFSRKSKRETLHSEGL